LAEEAAEVEGLAGNGGDLRFVHRNSMASNRTTVSGWRRYVLLILNKLSGTERGKTGQVCPVCPSSPVRGSPPLDSMVRLRSAGFGGRWMGVWR
jgi:formate dehydrogenase maturation protein FdhE